MCEPLLAPCVTFSHVSCVLCQNMVDEGYAATQILSQLHESIIEQDLSDKQKSAITEKMAVSDLILLVELQQGVCWVLKSIKKS